MIERRLAALACIPGFFLATLFPDNQLKILDYNRVVRDLNGLSGEEFLARIAERFEVVPAGSADDQALRSGRQFEGQFLLKRPHRFRWNYTAPYQQDIIADGDWVWVVDKDLEQVSQQSQKEALRGTPALVLLAGLAYWSWRRAWKKAKRRSGLKASGPHRRRRRERANGG